MWPEVCTKKQTWWLTSGWTKKNASLAAPLGQISNMFMASLKPADVSKFHWGPTLKSEDFRRWFIQIESCLSVTLTLGAAGRGIRLCPASCGRSESPFLLSHFHHLLELACLKSTSNSTGFSLSELKSILFFWSSGSWVSAFLPQAHMQSCWTTMIHGYSTVMGFCGAVIIWSKGSLRC